MRFITSRGRRGLVTATDLARYIFCPRFYLLARLIPPGRAAKKGLDVHNRAFEEHKKGARLMDLRDALELSYKEPMDGREVWLTDGVVYGRADRVVLEEGRATVVEYKTGASATSPLARLQAVVYGVLMRQFTPHVKVQVRDFEENVFYERRIGNEEERLVRTGVGRLLESLREGSFGASSLCHLCPLKHTCMLLKSRRENLWG